MLIIAALSFTSFFRTYSSNIKNMLHIHQSNCYLIVNFKLFTETLDNPSQNECSRVHWSQKCTNPSQRGFSEHTEMDQQH